MPNSDELKGKFDQVKGTIKEEVGKATGDTELQDEGTADRVSGEVQEGFGTVKRKVGEAIEDVGEAIKK
jgi:uncharacterized protein YjbJ (UPF0337 family)